MNLQSLIPKILADIREQKRLKAAAERQARERLERGAANLNLLVDDLRAQGIDIRTPLGKAVLGRLLRIAAIQKELGEDDVEMPHSFIGEGFHD